ncbi:MAG: amidohydrolase, partial [Simkaniaceae bacterium]|nr:amidohydrolase [Simkaniaceae bacterium]
KQEYAVTIRRALHQIPELSFQEEKTLNFIKEEIHQITRNFPYETSLTEKQGGIWLDVTVDPTFKRILLRSDTDALPIFEEADISFKSKHPGCMHACGHDCHSAMLLGALKALTNKTFIPKNNLRFVWQRAEEVLDIQSGGDLLVQEGVCSDIDSCYALHISSTDQCGLFLSRPEIMMSNAGHLFIEFSCLGGHVMFPQQGANAIDIMTDIHVALRGFELRVLGPNEHIAFVPSISHTGDAVNICPAEGKVCYSVRNFLSPKKLETFLSAIKRRIQSIVDSYSHGKMTKFDFHPGHPTLINPIKNHQLINDTLKNQGFKTALCKPLFSGEDFSYYLNKKPGSFWLLGAKQGDAYGHHSTKFNPDESVFWQGVAYWLTIASME